jgi:hypothetical protein
MKRRIWVAEGYASDGDVYGRVLQLPDQNSGRSSAPQNVGGNVERRSSSVLKSDLGDILSCPCISSVMPQDHDTDEVKNA